MSFEIERNVFTTAIIDDGADDKMCNQRNRNQSIVGDLKVHSELRACIKDVTHSNSFASESWNSGKMLTFISWNFVDIGQYAQLFDECFPLNIE